MTMEERKFVRVCKGLYRSEDGGLVLSHFPFKRTEGAETAEQARAKPWLARWRDWMSCERTRRFATLAEARTWFKG